MQVGMSMQRWSSAALRGVSRGAYVLRRLLASRRDANEQRERDSLHDLELGRANRGSTRRRNILFITVDQQRFDALRANGGTVARTPVLDALATAGLRYTCARVPNVVCMPSRASMLTGQSPQTHGVIANGVPLPADARSVARHLRRAAGYRTALVGKAHFEPHLDPTLSFEENRMSAEGLCGPWHGFEHVELATHGPLGGHHYADWMWTHHRDELAGFGGVLTGVGGGDTGAPEVTHNPVAREHYHTDWVADRTTRSIHRSRKCAHASTGATCRYRPAIPDRASASRRCSRSDRGTGSIGIAASSGTPKVARSTSCRHG
jgi:arylsulfatase A-like enzyme